MRAAAMSLLAAFLFLSVAPAWAEMAQEQKDECLVASRNCMNQVDDIQKRIHRLNKEIKKGNRTYDPAELKKLQQKLKETNDTLKKMEEGGGS